MASGDGGVARFGVRRRRCGAIRRQETKVWRDSASGDESVARFGVRRRKCGAIRRQETEVVPWFGVRR